MPLHCTCRPSGVTPAGWEHLTLPGSQLRASHVFRPGRRGCVRTLLPLGVVRPHEHAQTVPRQDTTQLLATSQILNRRLTRLSPRPKPTSSEADAVLQNPLAIRCCSLSKDDETPLSFSVEASPSSLWSPGRTHPRRELSGGRARGQRTRHRQPAGAPLPQCFRGCGHLCSPGGAHCCRSLGSAPCVGLWA